MRAWSFVACLALVGLHACSSSYVTRDQVAAGGAEAGADAGADAGDDTGAEPGEAAPGETGSPFDAGPCTPVSVQALPQRGGSACAQDASSCAPGDMSGYIPRWVPPLPGLPHAGACTASQIADAYDQCLSSSTGNCSQWQTGNPACAACLMTPASANQFGAMFVDGTASYVNLGACVALSEPCNAACGQAVQADRLCTLTACSPTRTGCSASAAYEACVTAADEAPCGCTGFGNVATACLNALTSAPTVHASYALCGLAASDFEGRFTAVATFLCGP